MVEQYQGLSGKMLMFSTLKPGMSFASRVIITTPSVKVFERVVVDNDGFDGGLEFFNSLVA